MNVKEGNAVEVGQMLARLDDISPSDSVTVSGETEEDGSIQATSVFMMPGELQAP